jgi:hypothetical protein
LESARGRASTAGLKTAVPLILSVPKKVTVPKHEFEAMGNARLEQERRRWGGKREGFMSGAGGG